MSETSQGADLITVASLRDYFRESVETAAKRQGVQLEPHAEHYVVNLLTLYSRSEALFEDRGDYYGLAPLARMLADAADAPTAEERSLQLQRLGDVALFVAGCLFDSLHDAAVDHQYYVRMGGGAYASLSDAMSTSTRGALMATVFAELAAKFQPLVDVLHEVCEADGAASDTDTLRLYAYWQRTGSREAYAALLARNIRPIGAGDGRTH